MPTRSWRRRSRTAGIVARARSPRRPCASGSPRGSRRWWSCRPRWARAGRTPRPARPRTTGRARPPPARTTSRGPGPRSRGRGTRQTPAPAPPRPSPPAKRAAPRQAVSRVGWLLRASSASASGSGRSKPSIAARPVGQHRVLREARQRLGHLERAVEVLPVRHDLVHEPHGVGLVGLHDAAAQDQVERPAEPDDARQPLGAAVDQRHAPAALGEAQRGGGRWPRAGRTRGPARARRPGTSPRSRRSWAWRRCGG